MARARAGEPLSCNATEILLRSGRGAVSIADDALAPLAVSRQPADTTEFFAERIELGLLQMGRRLDTLMAVLSPYRTSNDELHAAYVEAHDALGDLAALYTWVTLGRRSAARAQPARRRRPSGG